MPIVPIFIFTQALNLSPSQAKPLSVAPIAKPITGVTPLPAPRDGVYLYGGSGLCWIKSVRLAGPDSVTVLMADYHEPILAAPIGSETYRSNSPEDACSYRIERRSAGLGVRVHAANCMIPPAVNGGCVTEDVFYYAEPASD